MPTRKPVNQFPAHPAHARFHAAPMQHFTLKMERHRPIAVQTDFQITEANCAAYTRELQSYVTYVEEDFKRARTKMLPRIRGWGRG